MDWPAYLMGFARHAALKSKDTTRVGAALVEARFYVYAHFEADTGRLFYIGKGSGRRACSRASRNRHWKAIDAKHGRTVAILAEGLGETEAYALEAEIVSKCVPGELATYTSGGCGVSGYQHTEASRRAMSIARTGRIVPEAVRQRLSATIRSRPDLIALRRATFVGDRNPAKSEAGRLASHARMTAANPMVQQEVRDRMAVKLRGRSLTAEHRAKVGDAQRGRKRGPMKPHVAAAIAQANEARKRPVVTACGLWFESTAAAARSLGIRQGNIVNNCAGRAKTAGGFQWMYADAVA